jgi:maltose-binding protein MalE
MFAREEIATMQMVHHLLGNILDLNPDLEDNTGFATLPIHDRSNLDEGATWARTPPDGWMIASQSENQDTAWQWIEFCMSKEWQENQLGQTYLLSSRKDVSMPMELKDDKVIQVAQTMMSFAKPPPIHGQWSSCRPYLSAEVEAVFLGEKTIQDALDTFVETVKGQGLLGYSDG